LAARILGDYAKSGDQHALASARQIAQAEFELACVQRIKVALIERARLGNIRPKCAIEPPMPEDEPQRTAEAVRRVLPDLVRLNRYERRAAARRARAIRRLMQSDD